MYSYTKDKNNLFLLQNRFFFFKRVSEHFHGFIFFRNVCKPVFLGLPDKPQVLPQIRWLPGGGSC